jgi:hypothetical protein
MGLASKVEFRKQRLAEQEDAEQRDPDKGNALRNNGGQQTQISQARCHDAAHAKEEQEETGGQQEIRGHKDQANDEPGPPGQNNRFHRNTGKKCTTTDLKSRAPAISEMLKLNGKRKQPNAGNSLASDMNREPGRPMGSLSAPKERDAPDAAGSLSTAARQIRRAASLAFQDWPRSTSRKRRIWLVSSLLQIQRRSFLLDSI